MATISNGKLKLQRLYEIYVPSVGLITTICKTPIADFKFSLRSKLNVVRYFCTA